MKKIFLVLLLFSFLLLPMGNLSVVRAYDWGFSVGSGGAASPPATLDVMTVLERIVDWLFTILLVVAAIFIVVAGYYFVTATGNPETVSKARNFVMYALIGVAVAVASRGLVALVRRIVGT